MIMITMSLVMSIVIAEVAVSIAIPVVIVFNAAAVSLPVAGVMPFAIVARRNPTRSLVSAYWRLGPCFLPSSN